MNIGVAANGTQVGTATFSQEPLENAYNAPASSQPLLAGLTSNLDLGLSTGEATQSVTSSLPMTSSIPAQSQNMSAFSQPYSGQANWAFSNPNGAQDIHQMYGPYMFDAPDIGSEYNVLNDFLNTSLLDEGSLFAGDENQFPATDQALANSLVGTSAGDNLPVVQEPQATSADPAATTEAPAPPSRPKSTRPPEKEDERFYMNIADPSGNDRPEERMKKLLEAKFAAGILRPFNYVQGYARLNAYLEGHMKPASRQMMMRQIDKFRPKFREVMQSLTDMELTMVEMWVERSLMEYDRLFASLAIPACCWRRTGEIFRGNKEMAELIHVPVDKLRDVSNNVHLSPEAV
ncbi:MAG: Transcription factor [Ramalina farinacea]|uniref:Transcription factor n=1 Tax=Ramalina farinacea TaxID=258253 RepID=A0AA43TY04_9LECA|nr:Transcription factor [Ramalina farinacea]